MAAMESPLLGGQRTNGEGEQSKRPGIGGFLREFWTESKRLWIIAGPAIFTSVCQYSIGAITQTFAGQVGELELAAVSVGNMVVAGLAFGVLLGMGSALETLCGQAFGAGQIRMLGIYMQRSWVILVTTACFMVPIYIWSSPILELFGESQEISQAAGEFVLMMIPQLFAYAVNFPIQKFLQAQRKVMVMAWVSAAVLVVHVLFSWLLMLKLGWGLVGAAIVLNASWWLNVAGKLLYIFITTSDGAWTGFSWLAFADLWGFLKLSLASAVMLWYNLLIIHYLWARQPLIDSFFFWHSLEIWYLTVLIIVTGHLPNPLIPVDAISICTAINGWDIMIGLGFMAAISVRVSNELGAGNAARAKFSVVVVSATSVAIGAVAMILVFTTRDYFPYLFTSSSAVAAETTKLAIILGFTVLLNSLQPVLSGVAIGAGWQWLVAYVNIGCYYIIGLPAGILLGFTAGLGVMGVWGGMIIGIILQTAILICIVWLTKWNKEVDLAEGRVKKWGGAIAEQ